MNSDLNLKILEMYVEIDKINDDINSKFFNYISSAKELITLSKNDYQIEKTLKLNKISLKGFILDSSCCISLKENNIINYSILELKQYLVQYEKNFNDDYSKYHMAISLYEIIEEIEKIVDLKIDTEIKCLSEFLPNINIVKNIDKNQCEHLYFTFKKNIDDNFNNSKLNKKVYNICIQILNDIFNFYIYGYPNIPDEYL